MYCRSFLNRFELYQDDIVHNQVSAKSIVDSFAIPSDWYEHFCFYL